jgi:hypothetical protein
MGKWEYLTQFIWANIDNKGAKEYIQNTWPNWQPKKFSPETMIPELNGWGEKGWELVHMEPVASVGGNQDVWWQGGAVPTYSSAYFCVFKRRKSE